MKSTNYRDLIVWQKAIELVTLTYKLVAKFPKEEMFGLSSQMKRAAVSIPSNIAEGSKRSTEKDFRHFLMISYGSGAELETQIEIAKRLFPAVCKDTAEVQAMLEEVMKMLNKMTVAFSNFPASPKN